MLDANAMFPFPSPPGPPLHSAKMRTGRQNKQWAFNNLWWPHVWVGFAQKPLSWKHTRGSLRVSGNVTSPEHDKMTFPMQKRGFTRESEHLWSYMGLFEQWDVTFFVWLYNCSSLACWVSSTCITTQLFYQQYPDRHIFSSKNICLFIHSLHLPIYI